ncbi:MAG: hypothetical protein ACPHUD_09975 [Porticoccaceae bacterium]|jgi:hypothetical protein
MAAGDTKLSICSEALIMLGATPLSSFTVGTDEAQVADRLYDDVRDTLLMQYPYSWSIKKVKLAQLVQTPINEWKYIYQLPGNLLGNPKAVFNVGAVGATPQRDFEIYGDGLNTNYENVWVDYQYRPEPFEFPPYFVRLLKTALAAEFAEPITDQITKADYFHNRAYGSPAENMRGGLVRVSINIDGADRPAQQIQEFPITDIRF